MMTLGFGLMLFALWGIIQTYQILLEAEKTAALMSSFTTYTLGTPRPSFLSSVGMTGTRIVKSLLQGWGYSIIGAVSFALSLVSAFSLFEEKNEFSH